MRISPSILALAIGLSAAGTVCAKPASVSFVQSAPAVDAYDFVEVVLNVAQPDARNPFMDVTVVGEFGKAGSTDKIKIDGFCDSADGSVFRNRFMPGAAGDYPYSVTLQQGDFNRVRAVLAGSTNRFYGEPIMLEGGRDSRSICGLGWRNNLATSKIPATTIRASTSPIGRSGSGCCDSAATAT